MTLPSAYRLSYGRRYDAHDKVGKHIYGVWESPILSVRLKWRIEGVVECSGFVEGGVKLRVNRLAARQLIEKWLTGIDTNTNGAVELILRKLFRTTTNYLLTYTTTPIQSISHYTYEEVAMSFPKPPAQLSIEAQLDKAQAEKLAKHQLVTNAEELTHNLPTKRSTMIWRCVFVCNGTHYKIYADNEAQCCKLAVTLLASPRLVYSDLVTKSNNHKHKVR